MSIGNFITSGEIDRIDGIFSIIMFNFILVAPFIQYYYSYWYPSFYSDRLGYKWTISTELWMITSSIVVISFFIFKVALRPYINSKYKISIRKINKKKLIYYSVLFLFISLLSQFFIYYKLGGISGYIAAYTIRSEGGGEFSGLGKYMIIAEPFPVLLIMTLVYFSIYNNRNINYGQVKVLLLILGFLGLLLFFGGLKGSRSNTMLAMFWLICVINFYYRKMTIKTLSLVGLIFLLYMTVYGLYKSVGDEFFNEVNYSNIQDNDKYRGNALTGVLSGDLSRYEVQTEIINKVILEDEAIWYGESYLDAILLAVPSSVMEVLDIKGKTELATKMLFGEANFVTHQAKSTFIFGLVGESISNFHFVGIIFSSLFLISGYFFLVKLKTSINPKDPRYILIFFFPIIFVNLYTGDLQNIMFYLLKNLTIPVIFSYMVSERSNEA
ncbi:hypothetical protein [Vibrio alginolyticus]